MAHAIVTGVSRGLGASIAELLLEAGVNVYGISRTPNDHLMEVAKEFNRTCKHYSCDLSNLTETEKTIDHICTDVFEDDPSTLYLINNAAMVDPVDQARNVKTLELEKHMNINLLAPIIMTNRCLKKTHHTDTYLIVVQITSGAAKSPIDGWSAYCSSKAGLAMYTETVALEESQANSGNKMIAFDPGIMDTSMQETIRSHSAESFQDVQRFIQYKEKNKLQNPANVAGILVDLITDEVNLENGKMYSVHEFL